MTESEILKILHNTGAIIRDDHFVYTSGKHGSSYVNKDAIYPHTKVISNLCLEIAKRFAKSNIEVVIAPAIGGVILSQWTAHHLSRLTKRKVLGIYAEKGDDKFIIKRGYDKLLNRKNVLVVEDVINTGGSARKRQTRSEC